MNVVDSDRFLLVVEKISKLTPNMYKTKVSMLEAISKDVGLDSMTLLTYIQTMDAVINNNAPANRVSSAFLLRLKKECMNNSNLAKNIRTAVDIYGLYDAIELTEKIMAEIVALPKDETASRGGLAAQVSAKLKINSSTFYTHMQTLRALQGGVEPSPNHTKKHYPLLKTRYESGGEFKKKVDTVLVIYESQIVFKTKQIMGWIMTLTKNENASRGELSKQISAKLKIYPTTFNAHLQTLHALQGGVEPSPNHTKELYPLLKTMYEGGGEFKKGIDDALEAWDNAADLTLVKKIIVDLTRCAPICQKTKKELNAYVAKKNGIQPSYLWEYISLLKTMAGVKKATPGELMPLYNALNYKCKKNDDFKKQICDAVEFYAAVKEGKKISYDGLVDQAGVSINNYKKQNPDCDKTDWVYTDLLKRVPRVAIEKLAGPQGSNVLIKRAISDAEKQR